MNILFLTLADISEIGTSSLYKDLIRKFVKEGHNIYVVTPAERRSHGKTRFFESGGAKILKVKTLNITRANVVEKGIGTILLEYQYMAAVNKYLGDVKFDLVLYSTPPITFNKVIKKMKDKYDAPAYLMLKDIFPQNAVDLGMFKENSLFFKSFRKKEKELYSISDYIGCMSPANIEFVKRHNPEVDEQKLEICPNSIDVNANTIFPDKAAIRKEYGIPENCVLFVYGGNLGKPQGVDFLLDVLKSNADKSDRYFLIVGKGTEYNKIKTWIDESRVGNVQLLPFVPKEKYNYLVSSGDVGLVFLDRRFTIPNFPTRVMGYLLHHMPILSATDPVTDVGKLVEQNGCGFWVESGELEKFNEKVEWFVENKSMIPEMGERAYKYLLDYYEVSVTYNAIMKHFKK